MTVPVEHEGNGPWHYYSSGGPIVVDLKAERWPREREARHLIEEITEVVLRGALPDKMVWNDIYPYPRPDRVMQPGDLGLSDDGNAPATNTAANGSPVKADGAANV